MIVPSDARALPEIVDIVIANTQYEGFSIRPSAIAKVIAGIARRKHPKFATMENYVDKWDVVRTWQVMLKDDQLVECGFYYPYKLYKVDPACFELVKIDTSSKVLDCTRVDRTQCKVWARVPFV